MNDPSREFRAAQLYTLANALRVLASMARPVDDLLADQIVALADEADRKAKDVHDTRSMRQRIRDAIGPDGPDLRYIVDDRSEP